MAQPNTQPNTSKVVTPPTALTLACRNVSKILELAGMLVFASDSELMTVQQAAEYRQVGRNCLWGYIQDGTIPAYAIGKCDKRPLAYLVRKADLDAMAPVRHPNARKFRKPKPVTELATDDGPAKPPVS